MALTEKRDRLGAIAFQGEVSIREGCRLPQHCSENGFGIYRVGHDLYGGGGNGVVEELVVGKEEKQACSAQTGNYLILLRAKAVICSNYSDTFERSVHTPMILKAERLPMRKSPRLFPNA